MEERIKFEFRLIDPIGIDHEKYKALHNSLFKRAATSSEWIFWYHKEIGNLKTWSKGTRSWGVFDNKELIGIWSVEPKILNFGDKTINVGRCFAVGIHEGYRRHGLFVLLSEYAIQQEKKISEYEYILGFPQVGRTVIGGHFKAGWEEVLAIDIYSRKNEPKVFGASRSEINFIDNYVNLIVEKVCEGFNENSAYNNQRFIKHPDHQYLNYSYKDANIVLKPYGNFCHVLDLSGSIVNVEYLLNAVKSLAIRHGWVEVNAWCADNEFYKQALLATGFSHGAEFGLPVMLIAVRINAELPLVLSSPCCFQMGVEEGY
jgi:GNAT superfamily N-acetyltransferase